MLILGMYLNLPMLLASIYWRSIQTPVFKNLRKPVVLYKRGRLEVNLLIDTGLSEIMNVYQFWIRGQT